MWPPRIPDPDAEKPEDWDEDAPLKIVDPDAVKPDGWLDNGPEYIPDPDAKLPDDWDEEEDGEWEPPMICEYWNGVIGMETWSGTIYNCPFMGEPSALCCWCRGQLAFIFSGFPCSLIAFSSPLCPF